MAKDYINGTGLKYFLNKCIDLFAPKSALNDYAKQKDVEQSLDLKADLVDGKVPESQLPDGIGNSSTKEIFLVEAELDLDDNFSVTRMTKTYEEIADALNASKDVKLLASISLGDDNFAYFIGEVVIYRPSFGMIEFSMVADTNLGDGEQVYHFRITVTSSGSKTTVIKNLSGEAGGTKDYTQLDNKPKINGVELNGDLTSADLGLSVGEGVGGGKWIDLFEFQTLTEDISQITFDNLKAKKILIYGQWRINDESNSLNSGEKRATFYINNNNAYASILPIFARTSATYDQRILIDCESGVILAEWYRSQGAPTNTSQYGEVRQQYANTINRIEVSFGIDGAYFLKTGSTLGVKAYV